MWLWQRAHLIVSANTVDEKMSISSEMTSSRSGTLLTISDPVPSGVKGALAATIPPNVTKLEERGPHARIRIDGWQASVVGWTATSGLEPGGVTGILGVLSGKGERSGPKVTCRDEVDLLVPAGGQIHRVGKLHAGARVSAKRESGHIEVILKGSILNDLFAGVADKVQVAAIDRML